MTTTIRNIFIAMFLTLLFSSPSYAGFWDFMKIKKKAPTAQQEISTEAAVEEAATDKKAEADKAADVAKKAEADKTAKAAADTKQAEITKAADIAKKVEADKAATDKKAEADKAAKAAADAKQAEMTKAADVAKKAEADKAAKAAADAKQAEMAKATDVAKKAEADKAADAAKQAEMAKAADAVKKAEADKAADAAKQAEMAKAADAAKQAEMAKAADVTKKAEADKAADAAKQAEMAKAADAVKKAEADKTAKAAEVAKQAEITKAADAVKKAEADKAAKAAEVAKQAEITKAADAAKKAEADKAAKAAEAAKQAEMAKAAEVVTQPSSPAVSSGKLTPVGAEMAGNTDGTIPAWTGSMNGIPSGLTYARSGDPYPDPYAKEQPKFTIHAGNVDQYAGRVSEGLKALIKKYPDTFFMNVYPSHRDGKLNDLWIQRTIWNSTRTKLVNGIDGLSNYTGGVPFPYPKSAAEVMWNGRLAHPTPTLDGKMDDMAVYLNGNNQLRRQEYTAEFPFANKDHAVGVVDDKIGINAAFILVTVEKPDRQKGQMTIIHEALDQVRGERKAWVYIPGSRRVRRAPTVGFDTPDGPGGLVTVDDSLGFNGAMVRYDWKLIGKKEEYIPYNNYKFDDPKIDYDALLMPGHVNPDYMRYELHRVWVVEATLKSGQRHVYAKRRFYLDEDSWQIVLVESYDGRGNLWRVGVLNTLYDFLLKGYIARAQVYHDLQSGAYIAQRLVNETGQMHLMDTPKGENYYSPANLRTMGK